MSSRIQPHDIMARGNGFRVMIMDKYFSCIPNMTYQDGSKFLEEYGKKTECESPQARRGI